MDLNRETAMRLWGVFFGKKTNAVDYAGREIRKGAYNDRNSQYGWNVDHILPVSKGGKTADHNLICCHILTNDEKANSFPLFNANNQKFKIVKKQNHYEILNASDTTKNKKQMEKYSHNDINFYDAADGIRLYKKLKGTQNKKRWIAYIAIRMKKIKDSAIVEFVEQVFYDKNINFYINNQLGLAFKIDYNDDLTILIECEVPYKENINDELDKCVLLNTYLNDYFFTNESLSLYEICYYVNCFESNKEYYNDGCKVRQKVLRDINSKSGYYNSLTNTLFINEIVKLNLVDSPKVNEEDKKGDYYKYDYYFSKLSKDLRKESEE